MNTYSKMHINHFRFVEIKMSLWDRVKILFGFKAEHLIEIGYNEHNNITAKNKGITI